MAKLPDTIEAGYRFAVSALKEGAISTPDVDSALLLEHVCGASTLTRMIQPEKPLSHEHAQLLADYVARRIAHEPTHRIIGAREFYGLEFHLNESTLVPRPDTEILVDVVLPFVHGKIEETGACTILDLGTGTGAIALALIDQAASANVVATDISARALEMAVQNAQRLGHHDRFEPLQSDWFEKITGQFDLIVSNPPYIASKVINELDIEVRAHDPRLALDGGQSGLDAYSIIAASSKPFLKQGGRIAVEIGFDQKTTVSQLFETAGYSIIDAKKDLNDQDRVLVFG